MTLFIVAPVGVKSTGIGRYSLTFDADRRCPDPGLNEGERAHMNGRGYQFVDEPDLFKLTGGPVEPEPEPESTPVPEPEPEPVKPARKRPSRAKAKATAPDTTPADAATA